MLKKIKENSIIFLFLAFCSIVGLIEILEKNEIIPIGTFKISCGVFAIILLVIVLVNILSYILKRNKPLYADAQISSFELAHKSIYLCIHSLNPESNNPKYKEFNEALKNSVKRGVTVQIIAPGGVERAEGAYELYQLYNFDIKFNDQLEDEDLRFTLVDDNIVIISYQKIPSKKLSREYAYIKSINLNRILKTYFESIWKSKESKRFKDYIIKLMNDLCFEKDKSLSRISNRLQIPLGCLQQINNENNINQ